jgi:hypothetical protein
MTVTTEYETQLISLIKQPCLRFVSSNKNLTKAFKLIVASYDMLATILSKFAFMSN